MARPYSFVKSAKLLILLSPRFSAKIDTIMDHLWSPWRMKYIEDNDKPTGCIFCEALKQQDGPENLIVLAMGEKLNRPVELAQIKVEGGLSSKLPGVSHDKIDQPE